MARPLVSRRSFLALTGAALAAPGAAAVALAKPAARKKIPIGLEMYSLKDEEKADMQGTLRKVAEMGYEGVEFWGPYFEWTTDYAKQVRKWLDALKLRCFSAHTRAPYYTPENFPKVIELNQILGSRYVVMAHPGKIENLDGWKATADLLARSAEQLRKARLRGGFHNHGTEWKLVEGKRPIDILVANTPKDFAIQLDTATCLAAGGDPVAFIKANPGRVKSFHLKDWSPEPEKGYRVLLGEGIGPWKQLIEAAESVGGVEYYLIEQEGSRFPPLETVKRCLDNFKTIRGTA